MISYIIGNPPRERQCPAKGGFVGQSWAIQKLYSICVSFKIVETFIPISALLKMAEAILKHVLELATAYRYSKYIIKGVCHEIFNIQFLFCFSDAHCRVWLSGVMHTKESDSAVRCTPQSVSKNVDHLPPRCHAHRRARLRGGMHIAELDSLVRCTLRSPTPRGDAHCAAWLRGGMHTLELGSAVWCTPWSLTPWGDAHRGVKTPRWDGDRRAFYKFKYLTVIKAKFENILVWIIAKIKVENLVTYSL